MLPLFVRVWIPDSGTFQINTDFSKQTLFLWFMWGSLILFERKRTYKGHLYLYGLAAFLFVHVFWVQWSPYSNNVNTKMLLVLGGCGAFLQLIEGLGKDDKKVIFNAVGISATLQSLWIVVQWFGIQPIGVYIEAVGWLLDEPWSFGHDNLNGGVVGSMTQQTLSGASIAASLPVFFRRKWFFITPIVICALALTTSAMTLAAALSAVGIYLVYKYLKKPDKILIITAALSLISFIGFVSYDYHINAGGFLDAQLRVSVWVDSWEFWQDFGPFLGAGVGGFDDMFRHYTFYIPSWDHPHNEYIWLLCTFGAFGVGLIGYSLFRILRLPKKDPILMASFAAVAANAMGNFPLHVPYIAALFMVFLSLFLADNRDETLLK